MEAEKPAQPDAHPFVSWWSPRRVCVVLALLFAVILSASWWLTPIQPYATLNLDDECALFLLSPDGTMLATAGKRHIVWSEGPIRVWDIERGHELFSVAHGWKAIGTVLFSPDSGLLAAHESDGDLKLWNARSGEEVASPRPETKESRLVEFQFSPDGRFFVFRDENDNITFWNIQSKKTQGNVESSHPVTFAPDGKTFATFRKNDVLKINEVLLWKMEQLPVLEKRHSITVSAVAFSPDLKTLAVANDLPDGKSELSILEMMTGENHWSVTFNEHGAHLQSLSFNGEYLAVSFNSGVKLIRVSALEGGDDLIVNGDRRADWPTVSFSPNSEMLLVTGLSQAGKKPFLGNVLPEKYNPFRANRAGLVVRVWNTESKREVAAFDQCTNALFSPDGQVLATLREDRKAIDLWKVPFRGSLQRILGWTVIVWWIVVSVGWVGIKIWRKMFSRTNAPLPRPQSSDGQPQPADFTEPPLPHHLLPPPS